MKRNGDGKKLAVARVIRRARARGFARGIWTNRGRSPLDALGDRSTAL
jgi:hypothetical protein